MKGASTRTTIVDAAMSVARLQGLDAISIGNLAKAVGLSKSGLFAHFKSKEALQIDVLNAGVEVFTRHVVMQAFAQPRGEPRLRALFDNWLAWASGPENGGGCLFLGAAVEYDDKPGPIRDCLVATQQAWVQTLSRCVTICQAEGHVSASVDPEQLAFEIYAIMMSWHLYFRLLADPKANTRAERAFNRLLADARKD